MPLTAGKNSHITACLVKQVCIDRSHKPRAEE